jgi:hypothetical protein
VQVRSLLVAFMLHSFWALHQLGGVGTLRVAL